MVKSLQRVTQGHFLEGHDDYSGNGLFVFKRNTGIEIYRFSYDDLESSLFYTCQKEPQNLPTEKLLEIMIQYAGDISVRSAEISKQKYRILLLYTAYKSCSGRYFGASTYDVSNFTKETNKIDSRSFQAAEFGLEYNFSFLPISGNYILTWNSNEIKCCKLIATQGV